MDNREGRGRSSGAPVGLGLATLAVGGITAAATWVVLDPVASLLVSAWVAGSVPIGALTGRLLSE